MNLEEFRKSMESDATIENKKLKAEIKELQERLRREQDAHLQERKSLTDDCRALANRCFVLTQGRMCVFCQLNNFVCEHELSFDKRVASAKELRAEFEE